MRNLHVNCVRGNLIFQEMKPRLEEWAEYLSQIVKRTITEAYTIRHLTTKLIKHNYL